MGLKEEGLSERKIAALRRVSPTFVHRLIRPNTQHPPRPREGSARMWLHDVKTLGTGLKKKLNALWPPTRSFEETEGE